jgi:DNA-binding FadR family transcriptional regulator
MTKRRPRRHDAVVEALGARIVGGDLTDGSTLPVEAELGAAFGVSRPVIREAIKVLAGKGLVAPEVRVGTRVQSRRQWRWLDPQVMRWSTQGEPDVKLLRELNDVRRIIEPGAARLAAMRSSTSDRGELKDAFTAMMRAAERKDALAYAEADLRFHAVILASCENVLLTELSHAVDAALRTSRRVTVVEGQHHSLDAHEAVLAAILARQPDAAEAAMCSLIDQTARDIELVLGRSER